MLRKIGFGLLCFVALNIVFGLLIGAVAGLIAGAGQTDSARAYEAGQAAGASLAWLKPYVFVGSAIVSVIGAAAGWLPGTKSRPPRPSSEA